MALEARELGVLVQGGQRKPWALSVAVALAVLREGAETVLFVAGSLTGGGATNGASVLLACTLGLVAGAGVGIVLYAGLARIPAAKLFAATNVLIALLAASIASQLARALSQAGLIERWTEPLWDSSAWLSSDSAIGALLHALVGYDAHPSGLQLGFYVAVLASIFIGTRLVMGQLQASALPRSAG
jgi:high-affinity iron transporter